MPDESKLDVNARQSSNQLDIWRVFANAPAAECLGLYAEVTRLLVARNIIKLPRTRKAKAPAGVSNG